MNKTIFLQSLLAANFIFSTIILSVKVSFLPSNNAADLDRTVNTTRAGD
ncbi:MAG: hypothetical protein ACFBSE_25190 [Prochloraceae cyanobacterium]